MSAHRGRKMSDEQLYQLIQTTEEWADRPFTTAPELAEQTEVTRQAVHSRLQNLLDERENLRKYKPGRAAIYWIE